MPRKIYEVYLRDCENWDEITAWAKQHCVSFKQADITDVSDASYLADEIAVYSFGNHKDVTWFKLMWGGRTYD